MFGAWLLLLVAISIEVAATAALPRTQSFHQPGWTVLVLAGYALSIWLLATVIRHIPVSVTYAIWAGTGTALVAIGGVVAFGESMNTMKLLSLFVIVLGVVGLSAAGGGAH